MALQIKAHGNWKPVEIDPNMYLQNDMKQFICLEELTDYEIISGSALKGTDNENQKVKRKAEDEGNSQTKRKKQKRAKQKREGREETSSRNDDRAEITEVEAGERNYDLGAWNGLFVPESVMQSLSDMGYSSPTPIQVLTLPASIKGKMDIIGAAETGSGKTLAFGIPVLDRIIKERERLTEQTTDTVSVQDEGANENSDFKEITAKPLYALILTPTRELAIQVRDHIRAAAKYTNIQCTAVVGGMASPKQIRLLKKCPEIVVATPGRLWELIQEGNDHLSKVKDIRCLVIDEADRMVEKGHFQELSNLLTLINTGNQKSKRQTFVFSATLTFVHQAPERLQLKKKKMKNLTPKMKLDLIMQQIGMRERRKVIDLTERCGTTPTLLEARINCRHDEKDLHLFYFLHQHPGRTLVFANSKDCVRRIVSIFVHLSHAPLALHADMHQRQRLKNLDKFKANPKGLLIATDVAARGLDIPDVQHVIHYQVPTTVENYVHRSGRTARARKEGLTVMFVAPEDLKNYQKITKALNNGKDLEMFPLEHDKLSIMKSCVGVAIKLEKIEHRSNMTKRENMWFKRAAEEMDLDLDDQNFSLDTEDDSWEAAKQRKTIQNLKQQLSVELQQLNRSSQGQGKYPTQSGRLYLPVETSHRKEKIVELLRQKKLTKNINSKDVAKQKTAEGKKQKYRKRNN